MPDKTQAAHQSQGKVEDSDGLGLGFVDGVAGGKHEQGVAEGIEGEGAFPGALVQGIAGKNDAGPGEVGQGDGNLGEQGKSSG